MTLQFYYTDHEFFYSFSSPIRLIFYVTSLLAYLSAFLPRTPQSLIFPLLPILYLTLLLHNLFSSHCALLFTIGPIPSSFLSLASSLPPEALSSAPTHLFPTPIMAFSPCSVDLLASLSPSISFILILPPYQLSHLFHQGPLCLHSALPDPRIKSQPCR